MKKCLLLLTLLLCLLLTACGGTAPAEETDAEAAAESKTVSVAERGTAVQVMSASEWEEEYPEIYASYMANSENTEVHDYVEYYPMLSKVYEGMAFNTYYNSARGHVYTVEDVTSTGRPHKLANCFSCKTPQYTAMVNETDGAAYTMAFEDAQAQITEGISCYSCHANTPGEITISNLYLADAMGDDLNSVAAETLSCAQCHVEYYFAGDAKATTLPYSSLATMTPDAILDFYNRTVTDGQVFADYTNPRTGVRQIKVQHPEFETYMGEGSVHKDTFTCADCHMGTATAEDGTTYVSHTWTSPLDNQELLDSTCSQCHSDLAGQVQTIQENMERRTVAIGYLLEGLTDRLAEAVESGEYDEDKLDQIRDLNRSAQFYWDFVFVENSEGAHNSTLDNDCLDKAEALANQALELLH